MTTTATRAERIASFAADLPKGTRVVVTFRGADTVAGRITERGEMTADDGVAYGLAGDDLVAVTPVLDDLEEQAAARAADLAEAGAAPADLRALAANRDVAALGADDDATRHRYRAYADALRAEADRLEAVEAGERGEADVFAAAAADARRTARRDAMPAAEAVRRAPILLGGMGTSPSSRVYALGYVSGLLEHAARS